MELLIRIIANCLAILLANKFLAGFIFTGSMLDLLMAGTVISMINALIKPIISFLALPIIILTLGAFSLFINIGLLILADKFLDEIAIHGFWTAFWATIIFSLTNYAISNLNKNS